MHLHLVLIGLAAFTAAMPLNKKSDDTIHEAQDIDYKKHATYHPYYQYGEYASPAEAEAAKNQQEPAAANLKRQEQETYPEYGVYHVSYEPYPSAVEAEAAKLDMVKRGYTCYESYAPYPATIEAEAEGESEADKARMLKRGYSCYEAYAPYSAAVEAEAAKVDKRHMMSMPKEMLETSVSSEKRDQPKEVQAAGDSWYESYDPYSVYDEYGGAVEAEAAKME